MPAAPASTAPGFGSTVDRRVHRRAPTPGWLALLFGWLATQALLAGAGPPAQGRAPPRGDPLAPRVLRGWPGIGETRALAVAEALWEHPPDGPPLYLADVPRVGLATEEGVRTWLEGEPGP
jgi:hypothetical protein